MFSASEADGLGTHTSSSARTLYMILDARIVLGFGTMGVRATDAKLVFDDRRDFDDANERRLTVLGVRNGDGCACAVDCR